MLKFTGQLELPATYIMESIASQAFLGTQSDFEFYPWSVAKFRGMNMHGDIRRDPYPFVEYCRTAEFDFDKCNLQIVEDADGNFEDAPTDSLYDDGEGMKATCLEQLENTEILVKYLGQISYNYISSVNTGRIAGKEYENNQVQLGMQDMESGETIYDADIREEDTSYSSDTIDLDIANMRCLTRKLVELSYNDGIFYMDLLKYKCYLDGMRANPSDPIDVGKEDLYKSIKVMASGRWQRWEKYPPPSSELKALYSDMRVYLSGKPEPHSLNTDALAIISDLCNYIKKYGLDIANEDTDKFTRENLPSSVSLSIPANAEYDEVIKAFRTMPLGKIPIPTTTVDNFDICQSIKDCIGDWSIVRKGKDNVVFKDIREIDISTVYQFLQHALRDYGGVPKYDMFSFSGGVLCLMGYPYVVSLKGLGYADMLRSHNVYGMQHDLRFFIALNGYIVPFITDTLPSTIYVGDIREMLAEYESDYIDTVAGLQNAWCVLRDID